MTGCSSHIPICLKCTYKIGERGGLVVEQSRKFLGSIPNWGDVWCSLCSPHYWLIPRKRWLRPDLTEKKNDDWGVEPQNKQTIKQTDKSDMTISVSVTRPYFQVTALSREFRMNTVWSYPGSVGQHKIIDLDVGLLTD